MKIIIILLFLCTGRGWSMDRMNALAQVESGDNDLMIGQSGERGRYQISRAVWQTATDLPFDVATNPVTSYNVAVCILAARSTQFVNKYGRPPSDREFYLLWHRPARALHPRKYEDERAERFKNLCQP